MEVKLRGSREAHVAGANDLDPAIGEMQPHRPVRLDSVEGPGKPLTGATMDFERGPNRMRPGNPGLANAIGSAARHAASTRENLPAINGAKALGSSLANGASEAVFRPEMDGAPAKLTPKPATTRSPDLSSRIPASLASPSIRSLGHLSDSSALGAALRPPRSAPAQRPAPALARADRTGEAERWSNRRNCLRSFPMTDRGGLARLLCQRDQPIAFDRLRSASSALFVDPIRSTIRMRFRTGFPRRFRQPPSGPISKYPSGETAIADNAMNAVSSLAAALGVRLGRRVHVHRLDDLEVVEGADHGPDDARHRQRIESFRHGGVEHHQLWPEAEQAAGFPQG